ncbi:hypothetical protein [Gordonia humi]|uniref:Uncharacterized protein n=1 Tax=Gordonia humi TaxID=686429 RepID=A0A840EUC8_9ACTN|nr:hypothetical protein [Gordonia humi]MBB4133456.1 hypothetical protein [Gordonia humi]
MDDWFASEPTDDAASADSALREGPADDLWVYQDGQLWDLGPADVDADGDGVPDSITSDSDGDPVILTDSDGDGRIDRMTRLTADAEVAVADVADRPLPWSPTSLGRLQ